MHSQLLTYARFQFDYAIVDANGRFFNGCAKPNWEDNFSDKEMDAFTYTETGAHRKIDAFPQAFAGCSVKRVS
jgi:hypothetical protein